MSKDQLSKMFHFKVIQNIFEIWIFKNATFLKFWKNLQKLFIILASHMESFIVGSERNIIFFFFSQCVGTIIVLTFF
jgi:hypothetical protein